MGALSPCRDPFTLTSILSQGERRTGAKAHFRTNDGLGGGTTKWGRRVDVGGGIAVGVLSRDVSAWIPAFAGMTRWVRE